MKQLLLTCLAGSGLIVMSLAAGTQVQPEKPVPVPDKTQNPQVEDQREPNSTLHLFDRVEADLGRAHQAALPASADRDRIDQARVHLDECRRSVDSGDYSKPVFTGILTELEHIIAMNNLSDRNRDYLVQDLQDLRTLQRRSKD